MKTPSVISTEGDYCILKNHKNGKRERPGEDNLSPRPKGPGAVALSGEIIQGVDGGTADADLEMAMISG